VNQVDTAVTKFALLLLEQAKQNLINLVISRVPLNDELVRWLRLAIGPTQLSE